MSQPLRYALIDTMLGTCGAAWGENGLRLFQLPHADEAATRASLLRRCAGAEPGEIAELGDLAERVQGYFSGEKVDFADLKLDFGGVSDFQRAVYAEGIKLRWGQTTTYGAIARKVADISVARAVGQAMGANPMPLIMPCHRVLASGDKIGGFSAFGGRIAKEKMLALEGVIPGMPLFAWGGDTKD